MALLLLESATFPPQADHVLVDLFSSVVAGGALWAETPHTEKLLLLNAFYHQTVKEELWERIPKSLISQL